VVWAVAIGVGYGVGQAGSYLVGAAVTLMLLVALGHLSGRWARAWWMKKHPELAEDRDFRWVRRAR
jgi:hypothetical protein